MNDKIKVQFLKKTKIIATISNNNCESDFLASLYWAGMNIIRLNTAHQTPEEALVVIKNIRAVSDRIAILIDTKGPEIRTTESDGEVLVKTGDKLIVKGAKNKKMSSECICVSYDDITKDVSVGNMLLIDDGEVELEVIVNNGEHLVCEVKNDGVIKGRKSVNVPSVKINLPSLTPKDIEFIRFAAQHNVDFIAHSFVRNKEDVLAVQKILDEENSPIRIIAKIENREGIDNFDQILDHCYGIMVARGDLAIEIPTEQIPLLQKKLVQKCIEHRKPVIIATQMLQSMIDSPRPTRAEVSDVANACLDGTDAIMLSGETAFGKYPLESVQMMAKIAWEIGQGHETFIDAPYETSQKVTSYLAKAAIKASLRLQTKAIVADSISGNTIRSMAAFRGKNPIYAQCYSKSLVRQLALSYGIVPHFIEEDSTSHEFLKATLSRLLKEGRFGNDDLITVLAGHFGPDSGASYIEISTARNMLKRK
ncbi:pyruvate kinase [bacterium]|nr:pyruvate kinase [bacterium]